MITASFDDIDTLSLDLFPDVSGAGKLNEQSDAEYLALKDYKSLFHFDVKPELRIHGTGTFEEGKTARPASLLVLSIRAIPYRQKRPIKWASVKVTFEKEANPSSAAKRVAPRVWHIAPGSRPLQIECTWEEQKTKTTTEGHAELHGGGGGASGKVGVKRGREEERDKEQRFFTSISGFKRPASSNHRYSNEVEWILDENASQRTGIAPELAVAVLLERRDGSEFVCRVEVEVEIDWRASVQDWFTRFCKWNRRSAWYTIDPAKPKTGGVAYELQRMEIYQKDEEIRPLWYVNMPKVYKEFEGKEAEEAD